MKTAKKALAIVLAALMLIGTIPFAASAYIEPAANQIAYYSLKAEVVDATGAAEAKGANLENTAYTSGSPTITKQKADFAEYTGLSFDEHVYNAPKADGNIYVQPGQLVWVTIGLKTVGELYPANPDEVLFYTPTIFLSATQSSKCSAVNADGEFVATLGGSVTANVWAKQKATKRKGLTDGDNHGYPWNADVDYSLEVSEVADLDEDILSLPIYVDPNAVDGATGSIYMGSKTGSFEGVLLGFPDGDYAAEAYEVKSDNTDYTGAVLNFKVGFYTADLEDAMDEFEALKEADYTADTWADAAAAYADAADILESTDKTQEDIDAAAEALVAAIDALEKGQVAPVLDYTRINAALDASDNANTANATTSTKAAFDDALEAALTAVSTATTQDALDTAAAALEDAITGLEDKADMTAIYDALAYADGLDKGDWADETFDELEELVAAAQAILAQADDFSNQDAVDAAAQAIYDMQITVECADYNEVWDLMDEASFLNENNYTTASWADLQTALGAVVPMLGKSQQATVDGFAAAISEALDGLKEKIDTAGLAAAISVADDANEEDYTTQDWMQLQVYVNTAKNDYIGKEANYASVDKQDEVDQLANDIYDILAKKLDDADYSAVEAALAKIPEDDILAGVYTDESVAVLDEIAESLVWGLKEDKQDQVDKMAQDLEDAIAGLTLKKADYEYVDKYLAQAAGIDRDLYTAASLDVLDAAVRAVVKDLDITHQDEVTGMANDLYAALEGLEYAGANFAAIDEIAENAGDLAREFYTDDSLAAYDAAVADAIAIYNNKAAYTIADQATIDAAAAKGADAASLLVAKDADFTEIDKLVADALALDPSIYTEDSWAAFDTAFASTLAIYNNKANYDIFDQDDIDATAEDGAAAFDLLVLADADYTMVDKWYNKVADTDADIYTAASWAAYAQAKDDTVFGLKADKQADVDDMADALYQAYKGLVLAAGADYTAVDAAIADFNAKNADLYTEESVKAVEDAIANVTTGLNENHQDEVDAMAAAINTAIGALELKPVEKDADYTAVDAAIAEFDAIADKSIYTDDSVAAVETAIGNVVRGKKESEQTAVDEMAAAINTAIGALELKPVTPPTPSAGMVKDVQYTDTAVVKKTYAVKVEGRAFKIQFVDEAGNTWTYSRTTYADNITSYDEEGNVVNDMDRALAYEIWTLDISLKDGAYTVIARNSETGWETKDLGYALNVKSSEAKADAKGIIVDGSNFAVGDTVPVNVVTGKDVLKVQILLDGGEYLTFSNATTQDDMKVFSASAKIYHKGDTTIGVKIKTASGWQTTDLSKTVTASATATEVVY